MKQRGAIIGRIARQSILGIRPSRRHADCGYRGGVGIMAKSIGSDRHSDFHVSRGQQIKYYSFERFDRMDQGTQSKMSIFKRKKVTSDITLEERKQQNVSATIKLLEALALTGDVNMQKWQTEIKGMKRE